MKGSHVPEHFALTFSMREAEALRDIITDVDTREDFQLNEFEQEIVDKLLTIVQS